MMSIVRTVRDSVEYVTVLLQRTLLTHKNTKSPTVVTRFKLIYAKKPVCDAYIQELPLRLSLPQSSISNVKCTVAAH